MSGHMFHQSAALFAATIARRTKLQQMMDRNTTPEQRAAVEAERQAVAARWQAAMDSAGKKITSEFLDLLAEFARLMGQPDDEGSTTVDVKAIFALVRMSPRSLDRMDFSTPGYRDPRLDSIQTFHMQRPTIRPIVRVDDLCEGNQP